MANVDTAPRRRSTTRGGASSTSPTGLCVKPLTVTKTADTILHPDLQLGHHSRTSTPRRSPSLDGGSVTATYTVGVFVDSGTDSNHAVDGHHHHHQPEHVVRRHRSPSVADVVSTGIAADGRLRRWRRFPYTLAASGTLECTYNTDLADADDPHQHGHRYDQREGPRRIGHGRRRLRRCRPSVIDECVDVTDTYGADPRRRPPSASGMPRRRSSSSTPGPSPSSPRERLRQGPRLR